MPGVHADPKKADGASVGQVFKCTAPGVAGYGDSIPAPAGYTEVLAGGDLKTALEAGDVYLSGSVTVSHVDGIVIPAATRRLIIKPGVTITFDGVCNFGIFGTGSPTGSTLFIDCAGDFKIAANQNFSTFSNINIHCKGRMEIDRSAGLATSSLGSFSGHIDDLKVTCRNDSNNTVGVTSGINGIIDALAIDKMFMVGAGGSCSGTIAARVWIGELHAAGTFAFSLGTPATHSVKITHSTVGAIYTRCNFAITTNEGGRVLQVASTSDHIVTFHSVDNQGAAILPLTDNVRLYFDGNFATAGLSVFAARQSIYNAVGATISERMNFFGMGLSSNSTFSLATRCKYFGGDYQGTTILASDFDLNTFFGVRFQDTLTINSGANGNRFVGCHLLAGFQTIPSGAAPVFENCEINGGTIASGANATFIGCAFTSPPTNNDGNNTKFIGCSPAWLNNDGQVESVSTTTVDATKTEIKLDGSSRRYKIPADTVALLEIEVISGEDGHTDYAAWLLKVLVSRNSSGVPVLVGAGTGLAPNLSSAGAAGWLIDVTAPTDDLVIEFTGAAATTIKTRWKIRDVTNIV